MTKPCAYALLSLLLAALKADSAFPTRSQSPGADTSTPPLVRDALAPHFFAVRTAGDDAALVAWYHRVLGLSVLDTFEAPDGTWRITNLVSEHLRVEVVFDRRSDGKDAERAVGFFKVGFTVPDVEAVAVAFEEAFGERPRIVDFEDHGLRILQLRDPEGNVLQITSSLK